MRPIWLVLLLVALARPALATDGVLEINQTCAVQTGCFAGDTAGFPVTITGAAGRSYRLTSDLLIPDRNTTAISVTRRDTTIDLNGFEIVLSLCQSLSCQPIAGTGVGVLAEDVLGVSVKNGSITAMGSDGVRLGNQAQVASLRVRWNGGAGIQVALASSVSQNNAYQNGGAGIGTSLGSTVSGNTASENISDGILVDAGSTVSGNTASLNGGFGVQAVGGSTISLNTVYANDGSGIYASSGSNVRGNTVYGNAFFGISLSGTASYRENTIVGNSSGPVIGGVNRGDNYCSGTAVVSAFCP